MRLQNIHTPGDTRLSLRVSLRVAIPLRGIGVLDDEVAGVTGHHHRLQTTLCPAADLDHISDFNEMVLDPLPAVETGSSGGFDDRLEVPVIRIAQHLGEVTAGPEFVARRVGAANGLKGCDFVTH